MWVIRFLTGSLAGQKINLPQGQTIIGRSPSCDIVIPDKGISKRHAQISVLQDKVIISDLNSSNGTFVNGIRIQKQILTTKDRGSLYNMLFDIHAVSGEISTYQPAPQQMPPEVAPPSYSQAAYAHEIASPEESPSPSPTSQKNLYEKFVSYIEKNALPGIYKLAELSEFRWVLGGFVFAYIVMVTALSVVPMIMITKSSIEKESQRRALTIARSLAKENEAAILQSLESAVSIQNAQLEEGVEKVFVVSHTDGHIIAPVHQIGQFAQEGFVHLARQKSKELVKQLDDGKVGAAVPIAFYNPQIGSTQISAWTVVFYNMGSLAVDDGRTISMFTQTLAMALALGALLFYFMYKLIEHPIKSVNEQIDTALKEGSHSIETNYQFPVLQELCTNMNSVLSRTSSTPLDEDHSMSLHVDRDSEADNLVKIFPCPAMAVNAVDKTIISVNSIFEAEINVSLNDLKQRGFLAIPDQAFQLNLADLVERVQQQPELIATNTLEFSGINCELLAQAVFGSNGPAYLIITIQPLGDYEAEGVA